MVMVMVLLQHSVLHQVDNVGKRKPNTGLERDAIEAYAELLQQCDSSRALSVGKQLHAQIARDGYDHNVFLGNLLIQMYGKCGSVDEAHMVFQRMPEPNLFSWNILIAAFVHNGHLQEARKMFNEMPERDIVSWNNMVAAYAQNGHLDKAADIFGEMPERNVVSWNAMVAAYSQNGQLKEARNLFNLMPQWNVASWNCMVTAYAQNGHVLGEAKILFDKMPQHNLVSWNMMIAAYSQSGQLDAARGMFDKMPERNLISWNSMVAAYAQNGHLQEARTMFNKMVDRNVATWNCMIKAYAENNQGNVALELFRKMDIKADEITFVSILDACTNLTAVAEGKLIHASIVENGFLSDSIVSNALINMYSKCGNLGDARALFDKMPKCTIVSWTEMVAAYAHNGHGKEALEIFQMMGLEGMIPNGKTYVSILSACSHAGLLEYGWQYFVSQIEDYGMVPMVDHYVCMVDLLGRVGQLSRAEELIKNMPFGSDDLTWKTLLGACKVHGDVQLGARAAKQVFDLDVDTASSYILLSNVLRKEIEEEVQELEDLAACRHLKITSLASTMLACRNCLMSN